MGTEPNIPRLFVPRKPPRVRLLTASAWLRALRDSRTHIDVGLAAIGPVRSGWTTRPRTSDNLYDTHYLFCSRDVPLHVRLMGGNVVGGRGALAWLPPGAPYGIGLETGDRPRELHRLRFRIMQGGTHLTPWRSGHLFEGSQTLTAIIEEFYREFGLPGIHTDERFRALLLELSIEALRCLDDAAPNVRRLSRERAQRLVDFVATRIGEHLTPTDLAREIRLAPAYFARVFKGTFGVAPRQWLVQERIRHGARLLQDTDLDVGEIAFKLGYNEPRLFTRQFRSCMSVTPTAFRHRR